MKTKLAPIITLGVALATVGVALAPLAAFAQGANPPAPPENLGIKPDSPFYFVEKMLEWARLRLTTDARAKLDLQVQLINRRVAEMQYLAEKGKLTAEKAKELGDRMNNLVEASKQTMDSAVSLGKNVTDLVQKMQTLIEAQQQVLENVKSIVPEQAQDALQRAIDAARRGKERAIEVLQRIIPSPSPSNTAPKINSIEPQKGSIGTEVKITGDNFKPDKNSIHFGTGALFINDIPSKDGMTLEFVIPDVLASCNPEGTVCWGLAARLMSGTYDVTVINANGTSNSVEFTIIEGPTPTPSITWETCINIRNARILQTFPPICVAPDGRRATGPAETPTPAATPTPSPSPSPTPMPSASPSPVSVNVIIEADDSGLYPASASVPKGATVHLTLKVRSQGVYYGGLDFRSAVFNMPATPPGGAATIEFVANQSFTFSSFWPATGVKKADGTITVE